jgi:hypothetical protein
MWRSTRVERMLSAMSRTGMRPGPKQTRDVPTKEQVETHAEERVRGRRKRRAICIVEEEIPGHVNGPTKDKKGGPAPDAKHGSGAKERGTDELKAEMTGWSSALKAEQNVG